MLSGKHQAPILRQNAFPPLVPAILAAPLALAFSLGVQGDSLAYITGVIAVGVLASLDLRHGAVRTLLGFAVTLLASAYIIQQSVIGQGLAPLSFADTSLLLISVPASLGVMVAGLLLSDQTRYKVVKASLLSSVALAATLATTLTMKNGGNASLDISILTPVYLVLLAFPANIAQIALLYFLDRFWKARRLSLSMMPTAFFTYNSLNALAYLSSHDPNQLYTIFSSLGYLPAIALSGLASRSLAKKTPKTPTSPTPRITVTGQSSIRQGQDQTIKIATQSGGRPSNMANIDATIQRPGGNLGPLRLSQASTGEYRASYRPTTSGNYGVHVTATSKEHVTTDKSFSFTVQGPVQQHSMPNIQRHIPPPPPTTHYHPPQNLGPRPSPQPTIPQNSPGLSRLDNWDPKDWVNQEVHGYNIKEHMATGATGYVLRATFGQAGTEMALKIPILKPGIGTTALDETMSEASRLLELSEQSKYVVQLRGILVDRLNVQEIIKGNTALYLKSPPAIVMEFMKGGTAKRLLEDPSYESLYYSEKWIGIVMLVGQMIATGLDTIHKAGFVHLDVKPQNIMFNIRPPTTGQDMRDQIVSGTLIPKLGDLGSAVKTGGKVTQFTSEYAPGEQVMGSTAAPTMDVYALGAAIYNMLTKTPVNSQKLIDTMNRMTIGAGSKDTSDLKSVWNSFSPDFAKVDPKFSSPIPLMKEMLAKDPQDRPTAGAVANSLRNLKGYG